VGTPDSGGSCSRTSFEPHPNGPGRHGTSIENQSDRSDGRQLENHTHRDHQRYENRTAGTNNFGNQHLMISVDGKITVMNIELKGSGTSPEQIRNSLSGSGQVSGYLYPAVAGGSLGFASFATGLGSVFSTEMGFNSAVLAGFINHQSPITGELLLSGNTVTLQNHKVQGQNAIALITSRTSLTQAITDTTIALDTGRRGPADYVMTVKGPISSPTVSTRGGGN